MRLQLDRIAEAAPEAPRPAVPSTLDRAAPNLPLAGRALYHVLLWLMVLAVIPLAWGWRATVVTSGSMSPSIDTGDVIITVPHDGQGLGAGTIAVFSDGSGGQVAHRIVGVNGDGTYVTRGDANGVDDSTPLRPDQVVGVGRMLVPFAGLPIIWITDFVWAPFAWMVAVASAGMLWWRLVDRRKTEVVP